MTETNLRQNCDTFFAGHQQAKPHETFRQMAQWCETHQIELDHYGEGEVVQAFEQKVADLTGFEAGLFCVTGTMAQMVAILLACRKSGRDIAAMHTSAHLLRHENSNYQLLQQFKTVTVGQPFRPWAAEDLAQVKDALGAVLYELPMREIGGRMPTWEELEGVKAACQQRGVHLHMDGARLWEATAGYARTPREICSGFDSCYVSFYKGIGGLAGAMLLGKQEFIEQAKIWMRRLGGNVASRSPYVVAAVMQFDERLAQMPAYFARTQELYQILQKFPTLRVNPEKPHCNLFHIYFPAFAHQCLAARDVIAREEKAWLFSWAEDTALPHQAKFEWYVGDQLLALPLARIEHLLGRFMEVLAAQ